MRRPNAGSRGPRDPDDGWPPGRAAADPGTWPATTAAETSVRGPAGVARAVWTALTTVYVVWGSTYLAIAVRCDTMPPS